MKVLQVVPFYHPAFRYGGPVFSVHNLNRTMVEKGIQVDVATTNAGLTGTPFASSPQWFHHHGVRVKYFDFYGGDNYNFSPSLQRFAMSHGCDYDVIHIHFVWNFTTLAAIHAAVHRGVPYVITPRGTLYPEAFAIRSTVKKKVYYHLFSHRHLMMSDKIHFTTIDELKKTSDYLHLPEEKGVVIPNGIDLSQIPQDPSEENSLDRFPNFRDRKYLLFLARLHPKKGLDILVKTYAQFLKKHPDGYLVIAGPDNIGYKRKILELIEHLSLSSQIHFTGMLSGVQKWAVIAGAHMFILTSHSENFGMSVIESMACGTPVIISDKVGIYRELEKCRAGLVVKMDERSILDAMEELWENDDLHQTLSQNGHIFVSKHCDLKVVAQQMILLYRSLISPSRERNRD